MSLAKKNSNKSLFLLVIVLMFLAGCTQKLSDKKEKFNGNGISYEMKLPSSWEVQKDHKEKYNEAASFGAKDKKSNSDMFVLINKKVGMDLKGFGDKTRTELSEAYGYKDEKELYMNTFELNKFPVYKYTVYSTFKEKKVWGHLYYVETEHSLVQLIFYSADDSNYEKRAEIIDESVRSLVETSYKEVSDEPVKDKASEETVEIKNDQLTFSIKGFQVLDIKNNDKIVSVRFDMMNNSEEAISAERWLQLIKMKQNEEELKSTDLPEAKKGTVMETQFLKLKEMVKPGESIETIVFYELLDEEPVILSFDQEAFNDQEDMVLDIPEYYAK
ncbi:DUF5067 domain-containing protein [Candidatus Enterococcus mansonii]|uniref:DUF5067 domain-containing protein n=1 Tax=Candidatus Enterococcus mansonii TaxID=1834181 RepID=A0A242CDT1_9ENTE|nr:DUF5067 domain-containing protein [Enterococcus sp. 4G2_DIV0659]OTO08080.1 hypothetical protein A5880_002350 [Enterococcus sp. 4G2_DIV0659]